MEETRFFEPISNYRLLGKPLKKDFFARNTEVVAEELLGKILVKKEPSGFLAARIVEVEAYFGSDDPASHAYRGPTKRSSVMFGEPGFSYVYFCYGMHYLFNVVTEKNGVPGAVLVRAAEPLAGIKVMQKRRGTDDPRLLLSGPGRLTKALGITLHHNAKPLNEENEIFLLEDEYFPDKIVRTSRIGVPIIDGDNFRFYVKDSNFISKR